MSEAELANPTVNQSIPAKQRAKREQLWADMRAFVDAGGRVRTEADDLDPNSKVSAEAFAQMMGTTPISIQNGIRNGYLFGARFPKYMLERGSRVPWFYAGDVQRFLRERRA